MEMADTMPFMHNRFIYPLVLPVVFLITGIHIRNRFNSNTRQSYQA